MLLLLRSLQTALFIYPWTTLGAHMFDATYNPYTIVTIAGATLLGGVMTAWLSTRPRRLLTHALVHGAGISYSFLCWVGTARGVTPALPTYNWLGAIGLGADALAIATEAFWLITWVLFWWRGARLAAAQSHETDRTVRFEFELGIVLWTLAVIMGLGVGLPGDTFVAPLFAYLTFSLLALVWMRQDNSPVAAPYAAIALLLIGGLLSSLLLRWLPAGAGAVKTAIGFTGSVIGSRVTNIFRWLWARQTISTEAGGGTAAGVPTAEAAPPITPPGGLGEVLMKVMFWALVLLAGLAAAALTALAVLALIRYLTQNTSSGATRVQGPRRNLRQTMRALRRLWCRRLMRTMDNWQYYYRGIIRAISETVWPQDHRACYRGLLRWGRLIGKPRHPSETPHEYAERLSASLPLLSQDTCTVNELTLLYTHSRYGYSTNDSVSGIGHRRRLRSSYRRLFRPWFLFRLRYLTGRWRSPHSSHNPIHGDRTLRHAR